MEVLVTISIMGILFALTVGGFRAWASAKDEEGTAQDLRTMLRQTQTRAVTEGVSFCVTFDPNGTAYTISRYACGTALQKVQGPITTQSPTVFLQNPSFTYPDGSIQQSVTFRPTGSATPGTVTVTRSGSPKTYTLSVEGFTGRVSIS